MSPRFPRNTLALPLAVPQGKPFLKGAVSFAEWLCAVAEGKGCPVEAVGVTCLLNICGLVLFEDLPMPRALPLLRSAWWFIEPNFAKSRWKYALTGWKRRKL